jgi:hypothetical protein
VMVSQLQGHHFHPGQASDVLSYIAHARGIPAQELFIRSHNISFLLEPFMVLLCVSCHRRVHQRTLVFIYFCPPVTNMVELS